jgi:hypothetical protein
MDTTDKLTKAIIAGDYMAYLQSQDDVKPLENAAPLKHQDKIDGFLLKDCLKKRKYAEALEIIREQNLIYPKKSRYFADQIRYLEKLINNTKK